MSVRSVRTRAPGVGGRHVDDLRHPRSVDETVVAGRIGPSVRDDGVAFLEGGQDGLPVQAAHAFELFEIEPPAHFAKRLSRTAAAHALAVQPVERGAP